MEDFRIEPGDLEARYFNVEGVPSGDLWPFSVEDGRLSLSVVLWKGGLPPADAEARTEAATATARDYARDKGWLAE